MSINVINVIKEFIDYIYEWIKPIERFNELPIFFYNIGLALLTILIPFAIAILADFYQKRGDKTADFVELDLLVILDHVFRIKQLILYCLAIFIPFVFWEISAAPFRMLEIFLSITGMCFVIKVTFDVYKWTKGDVFVYRFSYLKKLERLSADFVNAWKSVWDARNIDPQNEIKFFEIFSKKIEKLVNQIEDQH